MNINDSLPQLETNTTFSFPQNVAEESDAPNRSSGTIPLSIRRVSIAKFSFGKE
jgi:hypothetical protein